MDYEIISLFTSNITRLQKILESILLSYGGAWLAWFLSFMAGGFVAGIVGSLLVFNWMYTPWLSASKRNYALRSRGFYYGLFEADIKRLHMSFVIFILYF